MHEIFLWSLTAQMKNGQKAHWYFSALLREHMLYNMHLCCFDMPVTSLQEAHDVMRLLNSWS